MRRLYPTRELHTLTLQASAGTCRDSVGCAKLLSYCIARIDARYVRIPATAGPELLFGAPPRPPNCAKSVAPPIDTRYGSYALCAPTSAASSSRGRRA
eukprot:scaffold66_cov40-Tisochrysis_lutea.AAC.1